MTKDGELNRELDRMRILLARVAGRVSDAGAQVHVGGMKAAPLSAEQRLANVLDIT